VAALRFAALCLTCCASEALVIMPVVDSPQDDDAAAFPDLDTIVLSAAHAGADEDLVSQTISRGEPLHLPEVPFAPDLVIHMSGRIGAGEVAYGRTCMFAATATAAAPMPHLFFSRIVKFGVVDASALARRGGSAITYHDGSALFLGGTTPIVERFDPSTGTLVEIGQLATPTGVTVAALGIGEFRVALVGSGASSFELIEADNPRVEQFPDTRMARTALTATALTDGRVIVIGGRDPATLQVSGAIVALAIVNGTPETRTLRAILATPRAGHTATRLGDDVGAPVLIIGGVDATGAPIAAAELFKPLAEGLADPAVFDPALSFPRTRHRTALMPDGSVLVIGGLDAAGQPVRTVERFSIDAGFTSVGDLPLAAGIVDATITTLPDGRILIAGGRAAEGGEALSTAFIARLDPLDGAVDIVQTDRLAVPRAGHHASVLCDGTVIVAGGSDSTTVERYNPPSLGRR